MKYHSPISITLLFVCILQIYTQCSESITLQYSNQICPCDLLQSNENGVCESCLVENCKLCSQKNHSQCEICEVGYGISSDFTCTAECELGQVRKQKCKPRQSYYNTTGECVQCQVFECLLCAAEDPFLCEIYPETEPAIAIGISAAIFLGIPIIGLLMHCVTSRKSSQQRIEGYVESEASLKNAK